MCTKQYQTIIRVTALTVITVVAGCGGGSRFFSNREGEVIQGELVLDSIPQAQRADSYAIGYGDALDVVFLYNSELTRLDVKVRPDGRISYPYVGEVDVAGMTVPELNDLLIERFSEIIKDPKITVMVRSFQPQLIYIIGEVNDPGGYPARDGKTLLRALTLASGVTDRGKKNGVLVIRRVAPLHIVGVQIDLKELLDDKRYDLDIPIEPFDIVYVPKSKLATAEDFTTSLYNILAKPMDLYLRGWQVANVKYLYEFYRRAGRTGF
ncbi:MAG: polysaccharide biosynthesis/export family protein [bacterium]|nr:MAG: polysaccharide biosynthesis/export family protein [bacterium]